MTHLEPAAVSIIRSIFALGLWTAIISGWMSVVRGIAMKRAGVSL